MAINLTDAELEELVEKVTERVIQNVYVSIGKSVVKKFFWIVGMGAVFLLIYLAGDGKISVK